MAAKEAAKSIRPEPKKRTVHREWHHDTRGYSYAFGYRGSRMDVLLNTIKTDEQRAAMQMGRRIEEWGDKV